MEVTTPASIAAAIEMGLKVDPNSYTESVTLLRRASLLPLMSLLGLKTGSDAMAMTSPVLASSTSDRKSVGYGKRVAVREDLGGRRFLKKNTIIRKNKT